MNDNDVYSTKDLGLGAAILSKNVPLMSVTPTDNHLEFVFQDKSYCEEIEKLYLFGHLMVDAKSYFQSVKNLKDLLHSYYSKYEK